MRTWMSCMLVVAARAMTCPLAECQALDPGVCSEIQDGKLLVNTARCPQGTYCNVHAALGTPTQHCSPTATLPPALSLCGERLSAREFKRGPGLVECDQDSDCMTVDGLLQPCICGLRSNGKGLCAADPSSAVFEAYWQDCEGGEMYSSDGQDFWSLYISLWVFLQTDLECRETFYELQELEMRRDTYLASSVALAAMSLVIWT